MTPGSGVSAHGVRICPGALDGLAALVMHESERNRLRKRQRALLLAASDMEQDKAAAQRLTIEEDGLLARALETAIAVSYMRPFTGGPPGRALYDRRSHHPESRRAGRRRMQTAV
jgi:hypothetical protein